MYPGRAASTVGTCCTIFPIIGRAFPITKLEIDSPRASKLGIISSPSARFAIRFVAADFMAPKDPENVSEASWAATPVRPRSCWIT